MTRRYLLDTGPAQDYVQKRAPVHAQAVAARRRGFKIGIAMPVLGELCGGFEGSQTRDENLKNLARALGDLILWPFDEAAAREYGRLFALLKRIGRPMQAIDIQIAAAALALGNTTVVTRDSDLSAVPGLAVHDWSRPEPAA